MKNKDTSYIKTIKQGWRMYYIDYDEMLEKVIKSSKDTKILHHIKYMINKDFELHINITKESEKLGIGRDKLSKFISRLVKENFLVRTDVGFKSNPFMYIPYRAIDCLGKQKEWKEMDLNNEKNI